MAKSGKVVATEYEEHVTAMDWFRKQYPHLVDYIFHIPNERKASYYAGYRLKRMGVLSGVSDLFLSYPIGGYHGLYIEIKSMNGKPTENQLKFLERMSHVGYATALCYGADSVIDTLRRYINPS